MSIDISFIKKTIIKAGQLIIKTKPNIYQKKEGSGNWLTNADLISEKYILSQIGKKFPTHTILSEENFNFISKPELEKKLWIIDPLDGTTNFKFGIPYFAVSVAYCEDGVVLAGAIYNPCHNELFWAEKGKGAFLNNKKIHVQNLKNLKGALTNVGSPYLKSNFQKALIFGRKVYYQGSRLVNFGSAALECAYVAAGRLSLYYEPGLKPWDIAAGSLLVNEAGGIITSLNNSFSIFSQKEVLLGNKRIVQLCQKLLK